MAVERDDRPVVPVADFDRPLPRGINIRGRAAAFWAKVTELGDNGLPKIVLRPDEMVLLEEVCVHMDIAEALDRSRQRRLAQNDDMYVSGMQGSLAADPIVAVRLRTSSTLAALVKQLALPDESSAAAAANGADAFRAHQSKAGQNRWKKKPAVGD